MTTRDRPLLLLGAIVILATACRVGPQYARPEVGAPAEYRDAYANGTHMSLGEERWSQVFRDTALQKLVTRALAANYDVLIAAARVLQARAQLTITRADQYPVVTAAAQAQRERTPATSRGGLDVPASNDNLFQLGAMVSWEADFWGKLRNATDAERANLLGAEWGERSVLVSVVSLVSQGYFTLRELDLTLDIAQRTLTAREESLRLTRLQEQLGAVSLLDVRQAEQLVRTAAAVIIDARRQITQQENALSILLGQNPGPIPRGLALVDQPEPADVPAGLPSALLERRPDIRQAEMALVAANAHIGVAKAALYPDIALTGTGGIESQALSTLFSGPAVFWSLGANVLQQVFNGGKLKAQVRLTEAQQLELVYAYRQVVQRAFREVSDALVGYRRTRELREQLTQLVATTEDAVRLSNLRYQGGVASYLEVLASQTSYFNAQLELAQARLTELLALVQLYAALGGGWQAGIQ
jgi:outer membrane protein, multidrug efflux system